MLKASGFDNAIEANMLKQMKLSLLTTISVLAALTSGPTLRAESVGLTMCEMPSRTEGEDWYLPSVFYRELVRQGFLKVARDDFGLATRDAALREPLPAGDTFDMDIVNIQKKLLSFSLKQNDKLLQEAEAEYRILHDRSAAASIAASVLNEFGPKYAQALEDTGHKKRTVEPKEPTAEALAKIDALLNHIEIFAQYRAVRLCHAELAVNGQTSAIVSRLARGYANMSQLCTFYLTEMRMCYAARALLYATELHKMPKEKATAYWNQAYVFTLIGLTKDSMWQLEMLEKENVGAKRPDWMQLVDAMNAYDFKTLHDLADSESDHRQLAALLMFRTAEFSGAGTLAIETAKNAMQYMPTSLRILHGMDRLAGVGYRHSTTAYPDQLLHHLLSGHLEQLKDDPAISDVASKVDNPGALDDRPKFVALLRDHSVDKDETEPSTAVFGTIIEELDVLHLAQRAEFFRRSLGVPAEEFVQSRKEHYKNHPLAACFDFLAISPTPANRDKMMNALKDTGNVDVNFVGTRKYIFQVIPKQLPMKSGTVADLSNAAYTSSPAFEPDYCIKIRSASPEYALQMLHWMSDINPNSPFRAAEILRLDWEKEKDNVEKWLQRTKRHPSVIATVAGRYDYYGDPASSEKYWREYITAVPSHTGYSNLARLQYLRGDKQAALDTVRQFLQQEDHGLYHASISNAVAQTLMAEGDPGAALEWAKESANSYSGWSLDTLAQCYVNLEMFDEAHETYQALDERYTSQKLYFFAVRHERDLQDAWELRKVHLLRQFDKKDPTLRVLAALHQIYTGNPARAAKLIEGAMLEETYIDAIYLALAMDEAGDTEKRDETIQRIADLKPQKDEGDLVAEIRELLASTSKNSRVDKTRLAKLMKGIDESEYEADKIVVGFCVAFVLESIGETELARKYYVRSAESEYELNTVLLSCHRLRRMGDDVPRIKFSYPSRFKPIVTAQEKAAAEQKAKENANENEETESE
ncbi:MAG: hypothetical protein KDB27_32935 [Planctomycetales bacterium]|nr:hypothetical protein [Planctomycetales bacterium]